MAAYLIVDVDDLMEHFGGHGISIDLQELAVGLRGGAALAAGLVSAEQLKAVAAANWQTQPAGRSGSIEPEYVFKAAGYDTFDIPRRKNLADALFVNYFSYDPEPVDELILATTDTELIPLARRVKTTRNARIRMWGVENVLEGTEFADSVMFQPLSTLLGIQQTKNVAVYIDFENIAISLNEQGYTVNLDMLVDSFARQAKAHGAVIKSAAYAPWGQRGTLPPLVDSNGREVADEAQSRLMMANIDPMYNLPGKNSADMRIAKDIITDSSHDDAADIYIIASGDRDFKDVINTLGRRSKQVILWAVRGSTSRQLENNPNITIEYVEDFTDLKTHQSLAAAATEEHEGEVDTTAFTPSQWSSVILQFDYLANLRGTNTLRRDQLIERLMDVGAVISRPRGEDLVKQAIAVGILRQLPRGKVMINEDYSVVEKTRLIRDRIVLRVLNTLNVRRWEYVNYGFLLKGLTMDKDLDLPGLNYSDQWRSDWIDCLVREQILLRELVPHRHNPDDLVPVIKMRTEYPLKMTETEDEPETETVEENWSGITLDDLEQMDTETADMVRRVVVSVEQFTSFRGFDWCPLGSLHKRLRANDRGMSFQRAVEYLIENGSATVDEYPNPQSEYYTKGISLEMDAPIVRAIIDDRDAFVRLLLQLYERSIPISGQSIRMLDGNIDWDLDLWFSVMETENVLNAVPGRAGQYSLFRTHHTVTLVAEAMRVERMGRPDK
ncbi:MAG: NYN domain-containing protein [Chloroflexi bacterium]|nr:NYN domain-containing protein [Chloroflexota bacterium]